MNRNISVHLTVATFLLLGLAACGGGGGTSSDIAATTAPSTALATDNSTIESFLAYQKTLAPVQTIDPQTLQKQLAPIDDTAEPTPLN